MDLHAAGLEYNPAAGLDLPESQRAFHEHLSKSNSLSFVQKMAEFDRRYKGLRRGSKTVGGVHAVEAGSLHLFALGSASPGMPRKEWEIPIPGFLVDGYSFCPDADVVAFVEWQPSGCVHLPLEFPTVN